MVSSHKAGDKTDENHMEQNSRYDSINYIDNYFDYEQGVASPVLRGRLKSALPFWISIGANPVVLDIIENGYKLPFIDTPSTAVFKNNKSAHKFNDFVSGAILELADKSIVNECSHIPFVVNPLSVSVQANGKLRLILDLRYINLSLWKDKIKFEDWNHALAYFRKGDYLFNYDLKSGYHHIEIFPDHTKFLGFSWVFDGVVKYFTFQCLPFGLSTAPYIFTKCLRPLVKHWRSMGFFMVLYIDDGWCRTSSEAECNRVASIVKKDLIDSGFVPNVEKSHWDATQLIDWLGITWNAREGSIHVKQRRIQDIQNCIDKFQKSLPWTTPRKVAALAGKIISTIPVVGHIAQLKTRFMYQDILQRVKWDKIFRVSDDSKMVEEMFFWKNNIVQLNERFLFNYSVPQLLVYSDASQTGCGAWTVDFGNMMKFNKTWNGEEQMKSSTWRELKGVSLAIKAFSPQLCTKRVRVLSDNKGVIAIVSKGSRVPELHNLSVSLFEFCKLHNISLDVQWIPRNQNEVADVLSREIDFDDWGVSRTFFQYMSNMWGPYSVDRFADDTNTKLVRFNSKFWCVGAEAVDAFSCDWSGENNWVVAPICLLSQVISHVHVCKARATLVVPEWPSSPFWPLLFSKHSIFKHMVLNVIRFTETDEIFVQGRNTKTIFGSKLLKSAILCIRLAG